MQMPNPIKVIREAAKLTQDEMADLINVTPNAVAQVERRDPKLNTICRYATAAGVRTITIDLTKDWLECVTVKMKRGQP